MSIIRLPGVVGNSIYSYIKKVERWEREREKESERERERENVWEKEEEKES